jgi:hypothetical protein
MPKKDYFAVPTILPDRQTQVIWNLPFAQVCKAKETLLDCDWFNLVPIGQVEITL